MGGWVGPRADDDDDDDDKRLRGEKEWTSLTLGAYDANISLSVLNTIRIRGFSGG
jgi:hypothetical protein